MAALPSSISSFSPTTPSTSMTQPVGSTYRPQSIKDPKDIQHISRALADKVLSPEDLRDKQEAREILEKIRKASPNNALSPEGVALFAKLQVRSGLTESVKLGLTQTTAFRIEERVQSEISEDAWLNKIAEYLNQFSILVCNFSTELPGTLTKRLELYRNIEEALKAKSGLYKTKADLHAAIWDAKLLEEGRISEIPCEEATRNYEYASLRKVSDRIQDCRNRFQVIFNAFNSWDGISPFFEEFNLKHLIETIDYVRGDYSWKGKPTFEQNSELMHLKEDLQDLEYEIRAKQPTSSSTGAPTVLFTVNIVGLKVGPNQTRMKSMFNVQKFSQFRALLARQFGEGVLLYQGNDLLSRFPCLKDDNQKSAQEGIFDFLRRDEHPVVYICKAKPLYSSVQASPVVASHRPPLLTSSVVSRPSMPVGSIYNPPAMMDSSVSSLSTSYTSTTVMHPSTPVGSIYNPPAMMRSSVSSPSTSYTSTTVMHPSTPVGSAVSLPISSSGSHIAPSSGAHGMAQSVTTYSQSILTKMPVTPPVSSMTNSYVDTHSQAIGVNVPVMAPTSVPRLNSAVNSVARTEVGMATDFHQLPLSLQPVPPQLQSISIPFDLNTL